MAIATTKTVYVLDGKEYKDVNKIEEHLTNRLGKHIDNMTGNHHLPSKVALCVMNYLINNKDDIIDILSTKVECEKDSCISDEAYLNILTNKVEYESNQIDYK